MKIKDFFGSKDEFRKIDLNLLDINESCNVAEEILAISGNKHPLDPKIWGEL